MRSSTYYKHANNFGSWSKSPDRERSSFGQLDPRAADHYNVAPGQAECDRPSRYKSEERRNRSIDKAQYDVCSSAGEATKYQEPKRKKKSGSVSWKKFRRQASRTVSRVMFMAEHLVKARRGH